MFSSLRQTSNIMLVFSIPFTVEHCSTMFFFLNVIVIRFCCFHPLTSPYFYVPLCLPLMLYGCELWTPTKSVSHSWYFKRFTILTHCNSPFHFNMQLLLIACDITSRLSFLPSMAKICIYTEERESEQIERSFSACDLHI